MLVGCNKIASRQNISQLIRLCKNSSWKRCVLVYRSPLCNAVHGKGQHQLGLGERFFKEILFFPTIRAYLAHDTLPCRKYGNPGNSSKTQNTFVGKGYKGMSRQTKLNRRARSGGTHLKQLITRIPRTEVKNNIDEYITQIWKRKWENEPHY